jgi:hypothetical protein
VSVLLTPRECRHKSEFGNASGEGVEINKIFADLLNRSSPRQIGENTPSHPDAQVSLDVPSDGFLKLHGCFDWSAAAASVLPRSLAE